MLKATILLATERSYERRLTECSQILTAESNGAKVGADFNEIGSQTPLYGTLSCLYNQGNLCKWFYFEYYRIVLSVHNCV